MFHHVTIKEDELVEVEKKLYEIEQRALSTNVFTIPIPEEIPAIENEEEEATKWKLKNKLSKLNQSKKKMKLNHLSNMFCK